jgi:hypothetical protein
VRDFRRDPRAARFVASITFYNEGLDREPTEAEVWMLFEAACKFGAPPFSIEHGKRILSDNIYVFRPAHGSPYAESRTIFPAWKRWPKRPLPTAEDFDNAVRVVRAVAERNRQIAAQQARIMAIIEQHEARAVLLQHPSCRLRHCLRRSLESLQHAHANVAAMFVDMINNDRGMIGPTLAIAVSDNFNPIFLL